MSARWLLLGVLVGCAGDARCYDEDYLWVDLTFLAAPSSAPLGGARVCNLADACPCHESTSQGRALLQVPRYSDMDIEVSHPDTPTFTVSMTVEAEDIGNVLEVPDQLTVDALTTLAGLELDEGRGHLLVFVERPPLTDLSGYAYVLRAEDGTVADTAIYDNMGGTTTAESGSAFFYNVEPGTYSFESALLGRCVFVSGWRSEGGLALDPPRVSVGIHAGAIAVFVASGCR